MSSIDVIGSQLDVAGIVSKLMELERLPVYQMENRITSMQKKVNAYQDLNTLLSGLSNSVNTMLYGSTFAPFIKPPTLNQRIDASVFGGKTVTSSNENILTATAGGSIPTGSYSLTVSKLAQSKTSITTGFSAINHEFGPISGTISIGGKSLEVNLDKLRQETKVVTGQFNADSEKVGGAGKITVLVKGSEAQTIDIDENMTWAQLKGHIDGLTGVQADIIEDTDAPGKWKLEISATATGTDGAFSISAAAAEGDEDFKMSFTQTQQARNNPTLLDLRDAINDAAAKEGVGITATIINTGAYSEVMNPITTQMEIVGGYKLMITSKESGTANEFTIGGGLASPGIFGWSDSQQAQDAQLTVNGVTINSSSNTVKDAIAGVTINLKNLTQPGETVHIEIGVNEDAIVSAIKDMVAAYNNVSNFINGQFTYTTTSTTDSLGQKKDAVSSFGVLSGDQALRSVQSTLQSALSSGLMSGQSFSIKSIGQVGLSVDKGQLTLDEKKLRDALSKDFDGVAGFFLGYDQTINEGTVDEKTVRVGGMLSNMGDSLAGLTKPLANPIYNAMSGLDSSIRNLQDSIAAYELRLQTKEDQLYAQFTAADEALRLMRVTLGNISGALASLTSGNS